MNEFDSIPSNLFSYYPKTKTFSQEASTLNGYDILQRSRLNSSVRGFSIKSSRTGVEVPFYMVAKLQELEEYDGELLGWKYESDQGYSCIIWND